MAIELFKSRFELTAVLCFYHWKFFCCAALFIGGYPCAIFSVVDHEMPN